MWRSKRETSERVGIDSSSFGSHHQNHHLQPQSDRQRWLDATHKLSSSRYPLSRDGLLDTLVDIAGIPLPCAGISGEDLMSLLVAVASSVPPSDMQLAQRACDLIDSVVRTCEVVFRAGHSIDAVLDFLIKCATQPTLKQQQQQQQQQPNDTSRVLFAQGSLERSVAASALRCLGCVVFENADRCTRWYDALFSCLEPFYSGPDALPQPSPAPISVHVQNAASQLTKASHSKMLAAAAAAAGGSGVSVSVSSSGVGSAEAAVIAAASAAAAAAASPPPPPLPVLSQADDTVHASLVCLGNLLMKAGGRVKDRHAALFGPVLSVLHWGTLLPNSTLPEVEVAGRVLSSALRAVLPILQAGMPTVKAQYARTSEDIFRVLRDLTTFGWACEALGASSATSSSTSSAASRRRLETRRRSGGSGGGGGIKNGGTSAGLLRASSDAIVAATVVEEEEEPSTTRDFGDVSDDKGSVHSRNSRQSRASSSRSRKARWQLSHEVHAAGAGGGANDAGSEAGNSSNNVPRVGASSWYEDSEEEDDDDYADGRNFGEGNGSVSGAGFSVGFGGGGGGALKHKRRIPVRVRVTALNCLAALAHQSPKLVQDRWELFIPQVQGLSASPYSASLLTVLLYDTCLRVRQAAASALASVIEGAPLNHWIALPAVHDAASALSSSSSSSPLNHDKVSSRSSGSVSVDRRAYNSLSDKVSAMVIEVHKGVSRALTLIGSGEKRPEFTIQLLKCASNVIAVTPYDRFTPSGLSVEMCALVMRFLQCPLQPVSIAALQCVSAIFSNAAAVADVSSISSVNSSSTTTTTTTSSEPRALQMLRTLISYCQLTGRTSGPERVEVLSVIACAGKNHPSLISSCWADLHPLLSAAFADNTPTVRAGALKVVEELLLARSQALSARAVLTPSVGGGQHSSSSTIGKLSSISSSAAAADLDVDSEDTANGVGSTSISNSSETLWEFLQPISSSSSSSSLLAAQTPSSSDVPVDTAAVIPAQNGNLVNSSPITVQSLLSIYLRAALSDVSPVVRAEAAMCISCLFPKDWLSFLKSVESSSSTEEGAVSGFEAALQQRDSILKQLVAVAFDASPKVRVAAARAFGAYLAFPEWKTQPFAQLAAKVLLVLMSDDNLQVRAKASWALGNLCSPAANSSSLTVSSTSSSSSSSAAVAAAAAHHHHGVLTTAASHLSGQHSNIVQTVFPYAHEPSSRCMWSPSQCTSVTAAVSAADDSHLNILAPLELYNGFGSSQSMLLSLLTLPLLRVVTQATLRAAGDHDKVSCTAVRTLGYCVQALLFHWLPLPTDVRDVVNPVILANLRPGIAPTSVKRAEAGPCPDDDLIKASMLALADIVAGSTSSSSSSSSAANSSSSPLNATISSSSSSLSNQTKAPSAKWLDVGEEDDHRDIISKRLQGKNMSAFESQQQQQQQNTTADGAEDETIGLSGPFSNTSGGGGRIAQGPPVKDKEEKSTSIAGGRGGGGSGAAASKFRFNKDGKTTPGGGKKGPGMDSGNWRERSSPSSSSSSSTLNINSAATIASIVPPSIASSSLSPVTSTPDNKLSSVNINGRSSSATVINIPVTLNSPSSASASPNSEPAMKVRWNACHAVYQIVPLTHRLVSTHPGPAGGSSSAAATLAAAAAFNRSGDSSMATSTVIGHNSLQSPPNLVDNDDKDDNSKSMLLSLNSLLPGATTSTTNNGLVSSSTGGGGGGGMVDLSQPSPSRPKVRRNEASGQSLMWAGVDHLSTANSPFLPKGSSSHAVAVSVTASTLLTPPLASIRPASPIEGDSGSGGIGIGGGGGGSLNSSLPPSLAPSMTSTPQRFSISSNSPLPYQSSSSSATTSAISSSSHHHHSAGGAVVITDPTLPSVRIGTTWVPPVLAALQVALSLCVNFKVRIAAAQALGSVPSRTSYRIPLPPSLSLLPPSEVSSTVMPVAMALQATAAVLQTTSPHSTSSPLLLNSGGAGGGGLISNSSNVINANSPASTAAQAILGYLSPALQRPGFDAYPPALVGLVHALENSEQTSDFTEYRYKDQLKGVIRLALLKTILLAERIDYGVSKSFFDSKAELLYEWLCAEEALLLLLSAGADSAPPVSSSSSNVITQGASGRRSSQAIHMSSSLSSSDDQSSTASLHINESFIAAFGSSSSSSSSAPPASPTRPVGMSLDDVPVRASRLPVFGTLQAHPSIEPSYVKDCFRRLASLFGSRVKTVPADLLRRFQEKAGGL